MRDSERKLPKPHAEDEPFVADTKSALLDTTPHFANVILYSIAILIIIGAIWAYFANIEQVTVGEGKVIPSSHVKVIQSLDGGIVTDIAIKEGQVVQKGQILMSLDSTRYTADFQRDYAQYIALLAMVSRLTAESYSYPQVTFPPLLKEKFPELIMREERLFHTRQESLKQEVAVLKNDEELLAQEIAMYEPLVTKGVVSKVELLRSEMRANAAKTKTLARIDEFREQAWTEFNKRKAELNQLEEQLKSLRDKMNRTVLRSPVKGVVKKLNVVTIGGTISPGMNIMEIVPLDDQLLIQAQVKPSDIAFINVGQRAVVKITAYDYTIYGGLPGTVEYISADTIEEPKTSDRATVSYYLVNVRTQRNYLGNEHHKLLIIPGMTASIHIITGKKTILEYILKPLIKAKEEALRER